MNEENTEKTSRSLTIRLPRISAISGQSMVLILLIAVGVLQTTQLYGLKNAVASAKVKPVTSSSAQTGSSGGSQLPTMVGGC